MTEPEIAWLAGLIEGEGSIVLVSVNSVALTVFMTDEDVIRHCLSVSSAGTVRGPYLDKKRPTSKPIWKWSVTKGEQVEGILRAIYPWMGSRRRSKIDKALARLQNMRGRERCQSGHDSWRVGANGVRYCTECRNIAQRLRRSRPVVIGDGVRLERFS